MGFPTNNFLNNYMAKIDIDEINYYIEELWKLSTRLECLEYTESGFEKSTGNSKDTMQSTYDNVIMFAVEFKEYIDSLIIYLGQIISSFQEVDDSSIVSSSTGGGTEDE